jgi:hypothetical protein
VFVISDEDAGPQVARVPTTGEFQSWSEDRVVQWLNLLALHRYAGTVGKASGSVGVGFRGGGLLMQRLEGQVLSSALRRLLGTFRRHHVTGHKLLLMDEDGLARLVPREQDLVRLCDAMHAIHRNLVRAISSCEESATASH